MNTKSSGVKRLLKEYKEIQENKGPFDVRLFEDNLFEWHFTVLGPTGTEFENGLYHGRISLPSQYPFKPPNIVFFTPNGRFQLHTKICLTITGFHPEHWQPAWGIRSVLTALISMFPTNSDGSLGSINCSKEERTKLAKNSRKWECKDCSLCLGELNLTYDYDSSKEDKQLNDLLILSSKNNETNESELTPNILNCSKNDGSNSTPYENNLNVSENQIDSNNSSAPINTLSSDAQTQNRRFFNTQSVLDFLLIVCCAIVAYIILF